MESSSVAAACRPERESSSMDVWVLESSVILAAGGTRRSFTTERFLQHLKNGNENFAQFKRNFASTQCMFYFSFEVVWHPPTDTGHSPASSRTTNRRFERMRARTRSVESSSVAAACRPERESFSMDIWLSSYLLSYSRLVVRGVVSQRNTFLQDLKSHSENFAQFKRNLRHCVVCLNVTLRDIAECNKQVT